ncbi:Rz-like spanin [Pseudomonas phage vB_PpuP-Kurepalu-1]
MTKYLVSAIGVLLVALLAALYGLSLSRETVASMSVQVTELSQRLEASQRLTADIQKQVAKETARANANRQELRNALKANQAWADAPVPPAVRDSLCKPPAKCSP